MISSFRFLNDLLGGVEVRRHRADNDLWRWKLLRKLAEREPVSCEELAELGPPDLPDAQLASLERIAREDWRNDGGEI